MPVLAKMRAVIMPPVSAFYTRPATIEDIVIHLAARILDQFGLDLPGVPRWAGGAVGTELTVRET